MGGDNENLSLNAYVTVIHLYASYNSFALHTSNVYSKCTYNRLMSRNFNNTKNFTHNLFRKLLKPLMLYASLYKINKYVILFMKYVNT